MTPRHHFKRVVVSSVFIFLAFAAVAGADTPTQGATARSAAGPATTKMTSAEAREIVTRVYQEVMHRTPDRRGMEFYERLLVEEQKSEAWLRKTIASSPEAGLRARRRTLRVLAVVAAAGLAGFGSILAFFIVRKCKNSPQVRAVLADRPLCRRILFTNLVLLLAGIFIVVGAFEWGMRRAHGRYDFFQVGRESPDFRKGREDIPRVFVPDPDLGFRPRCGEADYYNSYGTQQNGYDINKPPGVTRLLFIGDSVTAQGRVIGALKSLYGEKKYEYWNAGVESYSTVQEVGFYRKFNRPVKPDHVILTMVVNDMETTPLAFMSEGKLVLVAPNLPRSEVNDWLFRNSFIYRQFVSYRVSLSSGEFMTGIKNELIDNLRSLRDELQADNVTFTVLVLPLLAPPEKHPEITAVHRDFVHIVNSLNLRYFDLAEPVATAVGALSQPDDKIHPTAAFARYLAEYLKEKRLLDEN